MPSPTATHAGSRSLSDREWDIALALARGCSYAAAGELYGIAPGTVRAHVNSVHAKLGIRGRAALIRFVLEARGQRRST